MYIWCNQCRQLFGASDRYPGVCVRCAPALKAANVAEKERAAPNGGRPAGFTETDDHTFVFYPTLADAEAAYARHGADRGPRLSKKRPGQYYLTYRK